MFLDRLTVATRFDCRHPPTLKDHAHFVVITVATRAEGYTAAHHRATATADRANADAKGRGVVRIGPNLRRTADGRSGVTPIWFPKRHRHLLLSETHFNLARADFCLYRCRGSIERSLMTLDARIGGGTTGRKN